MTSYKVSGSASEEEIQKFKQILRKNGISQEVKSIFMTDPPELKGHHFVTASIYAKIEFKDSSIQPKNLFLKQFSEGHTSNDQFKKMRIMEKESAFFNHFLPALMGFGSKYYGSNFGYLLNFFPKCLHADDEMIVLENLVLDGNFMMLPKEDKQDLSTAKYVLENLAKFHATSYAYIEDMGLDQFREKWEVICHESMLPLNDDNLMVASMFDRGVKTCINILKSQPIEGDQEAIEVLIGFLGKSYEIVKTQLKLPQPQRYGLELIVINHGDFHNNNMLFKKNPETGKITDHKIVDFQLTRFGSPSLDIGYFLHTTVDPHVRRAHLEELLQHYYNRFEDTIVGFDLEMPLSFDEFYKDYKQRCQLGFFTELAFMTAIGEFRDVFVNPEKVTQDPAEFMAMFLKIVANWAQNNPKQAEEIAKEIVAVIREYKSLMA